VTTCGGLINPVRLELPTLCYEQQPFVLVEAQRLALQGIAKKPGVVGDKVEVLEYLSMTVLSGHDITDGAPVARFVQQLRELIGNGCALG